MTVRKGYEERNTMAKLVDGVKYDFAENVAEKFEYSVFHIRHLARQYKKGNREAGLKGFKHRGRWVISLEDAQKKFQPVDIEQQTERECGYESGQRTQSAQQPQTDWLDEL